MLWEYKISNQIKEYELRHDPVIITVNEFTEESSKAFRSKVALAHNTGQKVIPVDISGGVIGKVDDMIAKAENARRLNDKIYKMMARQCGKNDTYFLDELDKKKHADWYLEADECIEIGLAQFKRVPSMSVSVDVDIKFI